MKLRLTRDEWYTLFPSRIFGQVVEVPDLLGERWLKALAEFEQATSKIEEILAKTGTNV